MESGVSEGRGQVANGAYCRSQIQELAALGKRAAEEGGLNGEQVNAITSYLDMRA